ncbi:monooxygenase [Physcia stellaris]|nr:monooxygenase [Physcia stellaris]
MGPPPKIAIIGAGPAGMTLAHLLLKDSIPVIIYEGEASPSVRGQGGTLDLHDDTGLRALKQIGLWDKFLEYARYDGEALILADKNLKKYLYMDGATKQTSRGRPEIDREKLRKILWEALPEGTIRWNSRLRKVDKDLALHFDHGTERGFDLVVGADGAWSKIRPLLSTIQPFYAGVGGVSFIVDDAEKQHPDLYRIVNRGSIFTFSDCKGLSAQQMGDGSINVGTWSQRPEDWMKTTPYNLKDPKQVKKMAAEEFHDWAPELVKFTQVANEENITPRSLYALPVGHRWDHRPGATLIGDSAHLMTPFAGEGVNLAMTDALRLAEAIVASRKIEKEDAVDQAVKRFEEEMFKRAGIMAEVSRGNMEDMLCTPGAPEATVDSWVRRALVGQMPWLQYL